MDTLTEEQILERYEALPDDLKEAIFSVEMTETIKGIGAKYDLHIDKIGTLANEAGMVMFGATRPKDFVPNLMSRLGVDKDTADKIASDVNSQVFLKVRESLKKLHGGEEIEVGEVKKEDILEVIERPELPAVLAGTRKPEEVQNLFEVKAKEGVQRAPMEESRHDLPDGKAGAPKYKESDPYREPIV